MQENYNLKAPSCNNNSQSNEIQHKVQANEKNINKKRLKIKKKT